MADVTPEGRERWYKDKGRGERGQLILVGGVVVAFALVALVLLLNTVLFTENIATRGVDPGVERAGDHATVARQAGRGVVGTLENVEYETWSAADQSVRANISNVSDQAQRIHLERYGAYVSINVTHTRRGSVLVQDDISRNFTNHTGAENWMLTNTSGIRNFTMTVNRSRTADVPQNQSFNMTVLGGNGTTWTAYVNASDSSSNVRVSVPSRTSPCTSSAANATINWTDGTFENDCSFTFADGLDPPYEVHFNNSDNATGTYHLVVSNETDTDPGLLDLLLSHFSGPGSGDSPRRYPAVYSLVLEVVYEDSATDYDTRIRIAPKESPQTRPP